MLSAERQRPRSHVEFESHIISALKSTKYGYARGRDVITDVARSARIESHDAYRLVNGMICPRHVFDEYTRIPVESAIKPEPDVNTHAVCIQAWRQILEIRELCVNQPSADFVGRFTQALDDAFADYSHTPSDVYDSGVSVPKNFAVRFITQRMTISPAAFDIFFQHTNSHYDMDDYDDDTEAEITHTAMIPLLKTRTVCDFFTTPPVDYDDFILALPETPLPLWAVRVNAI